MLHNGFMKIFQGLLFIFFDIRLGRIDLIFPDFIGYILIVNGLSILSSIHPQFLKARAFAIAMIFFSLADLIKLNQEISLHDSFTYHLDLFFPITTIGTILNLIMIWHICSGIIELSLRSENLALAAAATTRRNLCIVLEILEWCCLGIFFIMSKIFLAMIIPLVIFSIVVACLIMALMKRSAEELAV